MKNLLFIFCVCSQLNFYSQDNANSYKLEVPLIKFGERQDYSVLSFESLDNGKYSILYSQELPATVLGELEFGADSIVGAFEEVKLRKFIPNSNRVLFLVRQTFSEDGTNSTDYWALAIREIKSDMIYRLYYPMHFVHPIIANNIEIKHSLKNIDLIKGLTPREFEALTLLGKRNYNFYTYPNPIFTVKVPNLIENLQMIKSSLEELSATLGKGDIPKDEKMLFKRKVKDKIRMMGAYKDYGKDSTEVKLYVAKDDKANYENLGTKIYRGDVNPSFATEIFFNENLEPAASYGHVIHKYKDSLGESRNEILCIGLDNQGEANFWKLDAGKNKLNSFSPEFSFVKDNALYTYSSNNEKVFKGYSQVHRFLSNGVTERLYPTTDAEIGADKSETITTYQRDEELPFGESFLRGKITKLPFGVRAAGLSNFYIFNQRYDNVSPDGRSATTTFGNLYFVHFDKDWKVKTTYEISDNRSQKPVEPELISQSVNSSFYLLNYQKKLKVILLETGLVVENLDTKTTSLVQMINNEYISRSPFGSILLHKTIMGNTYTLDIYPSK